jgi:3-hydroxyisobutyrate dehydrogenase
MSSKIAFIGLGNMGGPMAINLGVKGNLDVIAFDLSEASRAQVAAAGGRVAGTLDAALDGTDAVITMLPNGQIVESLLIDQDAVLSRLPAGALVIDCSTVSPATSRRVAAVAAEKSLRFVDAPVSGGVAAAKAGTLAFMCGGAAGHVAAARELLGKMGAHVFHAGDSGAGSVAKICNNMLLAVHMAGTAEALALGVKNGLDAKVLSEIMLKSSGANWSLEKYNPYPGVMDNVPASRDYSGGFMTRLMLKDLALAMEAAHGCGAWTPLGELAQQLYRQQAEAAGDDGLADFSSVQKLFTATA